MKITKMKKLMSLMLCIVLVAALALITTGCGNKNEEGRDPTAPTVVTITDGQTMGTGDTNFTLKVVDGEGKEITAQISTDEKTVGAALTALNLIAGEQGEYGLYIKTVNGMTLDYDKDGKYWAFYVDGEYAAKSADLTEIVADSTYMLKAE